jgi:hypothetical protein
MYPDGSLSYLSALVSRDWLQEGGNGRYLPTPSLRHATMRGLACGS